MGDTPGVRTRLQSKLATHCGNSPKKSSQNCTKLSLGCERGLRSTQPKKVDEKTISNAKQNGNSERSPSNSNESISTGRKDVTVSLNKIDSCKNGPKSPRRNGDEQSSSTSNKKSMPSSPNTRSRSALKLSLSLTNSRPNTRSSSANKQLFHHKKEMSLVESGCLRKTASKKSVTKQLPQKRKVSYTSQSEDDEFDVSPKKGSTSSRNTSSSETFTPRKNDDAMQEDAKMSVESSGVKRVSNRPNKREKYSSESDDSGKGSSKKREITSSLQTKNSGRKRSTNKPSPQKIRSSCTCVSVKDILEASPHEKIFSSNSAEAKNRTSKKDANAVQEDINKSLGSLEEKNASTKVLDINNAYNVVDEFCFALDEDEQILGAICLHYASSKHLKSPSISVEPTCKDGRNSPLVSNSLQDSTHLSASRSSTVRKYDVGASHRLSPDKTSVGNTASVKSTSCNKTSLTEMCTYEDSSDDTFEYISENVPEENEISLNSKHKTFDVPKNLDNDDNSKGSSNREIVLLDDVSNDENPVVELNNLSTLPHSTFARDIKVTEEKKLCSSNGHKRHSSFEDENGFQNPLSKKYSCHSITSDGRNSSPYKSPFTTLFSKSNADKLGEANARENVPDKSSQCYSKVTSITQGASQSPKSPNKLVAPVLTVSSDKKLVTECSKQCTEVSVLGSGSSDEYELSTSIPDTNDKHVQNDEQNEQKQNERDIIHDEDDDDDSTFHGKVARLENGNKSVVPKEAEVTNLITLDSDESSEFSVTEVETLQVEQSGQETIAESIENEDIIEVRGVVNDAGNESTEDEVGMNEIEDDDIEVIEDMINSGERSSEKLLNKGAKEGSANIDEIISSQRKVVSGQSLFKESILNNKGLVRNPAFTKVSNNLFSGNASETGVCAFFNDETSLHRQSEEDYGTIKSTKLNQAPAVSTTWYLNSAVSIYKSKNLGSRNITSPNMSSDVKCREGNKMQMSADASQHLAKKLKEKNVIAASKVLNANLDVSSSDVEEIVDSNTASGKNDKILKECLKSSSSVGAKSRVQGKHGLGRTISKNVNEIMESDSDAESRKEIRQKIKMRIAESVAVSAGSNCKKESDDHIEDPASPPGNVSSSAGCRSTVEPHARMMETKQQQVLKIQRWKRLEMLKQQKEEKLNRLKECMASKEDASCSSSESSANERKKRDSKSYLRDGFVVSSTNRAVKQERRPVGLHNAVRKKRKMKHPSIKVTDYTKPKCRATTEWIVEDLSRNSSNLRRLPESVLDQLDNHQPRRLPNGGNKVAKGGQKHAKRKHWKETGSSVNGFHVATDADFMPLKTGTTIQFGVMPLDKMAKAAPANAKASADFRHSMLYGSRVHRQPAKTLLDRQLKLKAGGKDGLVRPFHFLSGFSA